MSRVEEIEQAISRLTPEEFRQVAEWLHQADQAQWERQLDSDSLSGKLNFLFDEAQELTSLRDWPPAK